MTDMRRAMLRPRYLRHEETVASLKSACAYCEEIIRQEPKCAGAHAELALALFLLEQLGAASRQDVEPKVRSAVDRALCLDEKASMSLVCLARQEYRYDWNWNRAERHFRQALEADPSDADVFTEFSIMLSIMRRFDESLSCIRQACLLDPISPAARLQAGHAHYAAGQWEAAVAEYQRVLRCTPRHAFARWGLADALTRLGQPRQAIAILMEGVCMAGTDGNPLLLTSLSRTKAVLEARAASPLRLLEAPQQTRDPVLLAEL
jgi:tetratricopeptide (TPR) repeat protein